MMIVLHNQLRSKTEQESNEMKEKERKEISEKERREIKIRMERNYVTETNRRDELQR